MIDKTKSKLTREKYDSFLGMLTQCDFCFNHLNWHKTNTSISWYSTGENWSKHFCSKNCESQYEVVN